MRKTIKRTLGWMLTFLLFGSMVSMNISTLGVKGTALMWGGLLLLFLALCLIVWLFTSD